MDDHYDVLIVGAGLSGIGAACHLRRKLPHKSFAILEAREAIGGTWDLFRYPGVRSDSDMFTLGYSFKPWEQGEAIADGSSILEYVRETAREYGVERAVRFGHRVVRAEWDSTAARWTVEVACEEGTERLTLTCTFLHWCSGYYDYEQPFDPEFAGIGDFRGTIVHPQRWPEQLDYSGKRVLVIGSGATAVTLVPAMADRAAHVTMLQRSPTYIVSLPERDGLADRLRERLPKNATYTAVRLKNVLRMMFVFQLSRRRPELVKRMLRKGLERELPDGFDIDTHLTPRYNPWDQRMCLVPNGDLFAAIRDGRAAIVTDKIETFTENGVLLSSGQELGADVIVTATGLNLRFLGGAAIVVDGRQLDPAETVAYKGMMLSGAPNMALAVGYTNASWTLKCDLVCEYVCRLISHMDEHDYAYCVPLAPERGERLEPLMDLQSGYVLRAIDRLPKQAGRPPWRLHQNYFKDLRLFRRGPLEDEGIRFAPREDERNRFVPGEDQVPGRPRSWAPVNTSISNGRPSMITPRVETE